MGPLQKTKMNSHTLLGPILSISIKVLRTWKAIENLKIWKSIGRCLLAIRELPSPSITSFSWQLSTVTPKSLNHILKFLSSRCAMLLGMHLRTMSRTWTSRLICRDTWGVKLWSLTPSAKIKKSACTMKTIRKMLTTPCRSIRLVARKRIRCPYKS